MMRIIRPSETPQPTTKVVVMNLRNGSSIRTEPMPAAEADALLAQVHSEMRNPERMTRMGPVPRLVSLGGAGGAVVSDIESVTAVPI